MCNRKETCIKQLDPTQSTTVLVTHQLGNGEFEAFPAIVRTGDDETIQAQVAARQLNAPLFAR